MVSFTLQVLSLFALLAAAFCETCVEPKITSKSFTTQDATIVTNIAYVSEFTVECGTGYVSNLYAEFDGHIQPASLIGANKFQVSWTEETNNARSGERVVRLFEEDGYTALRKAIRNGEELTSVKPLFNVNVHHPGAFSGPWLKSEFLAASLSVVVAYFAFSSRSKLLS